MPSDNPLEELAQALAPRREYLYEHLTKVSPWTIGDRESLDGDDLNGLHHALRALANLDALPCQPLTTPEGARRALSGRSTVDQFFWAGLEELAHVFLISDDHVLVGACAIGTTNKNEIVVPWMHAGENPGLIRRLVQLVEDRAAGRPNSFFGFAGLIGQALEGSPRQHRPYTHKVLMDAGYMAHDDWGYWANPDITAGPWMDDLDVAEVCDPDPDEGPDYIPFKIKRPNAATGLTETVGEAGLTIAPFSVAQVWWLNVSDELRGHGFGRRLFHQVLREAAKREAVQACLQVDDGDPAERDREPAKRLYFTCGFREVDRLVNYTKPCGAANPCGNTRLSRVPTDS